MMRPFPNADRWALDEPDPHAGHVPCDECGDCLTCGVGTHWCWRQEEDDGA